MITFAQQHAHFALGKHIRCQKGLQGIHTVTFSWQRHDPLKVSTKCLPLTSWHFLIFVVLVFLATSLHRSCKASPLHPPQEAETWLLSQFKLHKGMTRYGRFDICYHLKGFSATSASSSGCRHLQQHTYLWRSWGSCNCFVPNEKSPFFLPFADRMFCAMHRATKEGSLFP